MKIVIKKDDVEITFEPHNPTEYNHAQCMIRSILGTPGDKPTKPGRSKPVDSDLNRARADYIETLLTNTREPRNAIEIASRAKGHPLFPGEDPVHLVRRALADTRFTKALTGGFVLTSKAEFFNSLAKLRSGEPVVIKEFRTEEQPSTDDDLNDPFADE